MLKTIKINGRTFDAVDRAFGCGTWEIESNGLLSLQKQTYFPVYGAAGDLLPEIVSYHVTANDGQGNVEAEERRTSTRGAFNAALRA